MRRNYIYGKIETLYYLFYRIICELTWCQPGYQSKSWNFTNFIHSLRTISQLPVNPGTVYDYFQSHFNRFAAYDIA